MKKLPIILLFLFFNHLLFSQTPVLITAEYSETPLEVVLKDLQKKSGKPFFYKQEWMQQKKVSVRIENQPVFDAVRMVLKENDLTYIYYEPHIVVLPGDVEKDYPPNTEITTALVPANVWPSRTLKINKQVSNSKTNYKLTGKITDQSTGEPVVGATILFEEIKIGQASDVNGFYSITAPPGKYVVSYSSIGSGTVKRSIDLKKSSVLDIEMEPTVVEIGEVTVYGEAEDKNVTKAEISKTKLDIKTLKKMPAFMGEVDVLKSIVLLPGVTTVGEGSSGFNVRGGSVDQNLILFDDAPLYNPNHMFGLFSVFNPDVVKEVTLYRGGIPAQFGGRVSSVLDIKSKDLTAKKMTGKGGIGIVASRLSLEGPIIQDKLKFMIGARGSFANPFLKLSSNTSISTTRAHFYDLNGKLEWTVGEKDKVFFSGYHGKDAFRFSADSVASLDQNASANKFGWGNTNGSLRWGHIFSSKLIGNLTAIYSNYKTSMSSTKEGSTFDIPSSIDYKSLKADLSYQPAVAHKITGGLSTILYKLLPPRINPGENSSINPFPSELEYGMESAAYLNDEFIVNTSITVSGGLRYSLYQYLGPKTVYTYQDGIPRDVDVITDTVTYSRNQKITSYSGLEPRLSVKINVSENASIKGGYTKLRQYLGLVSNTSSAVPTDRWKLADQYVLPQISDQYSLGFFKNFLNNAIETSVEVYYKDIQNMLDYKNGANLLVNKALEKDLVSAAGRAYGAELMLRKVKGNLMGWVSYTYSRTEIRTNSKYEVEKVNNNRYYPANYDKPHFLNMVLTYQRNKRWNLAANFTYSTGRPFSYPDGKYIINNASVPNFPSRNNSRIPDYHRLDLSATVETNHKKNKKWEGSWTFSIYNLYNRKNAYSVFFRNQQSYKLTILGSTFPSVTYNFKF